VSRLLINQEIPDSDAMHQLGVDLAAQLKAGDVVVLTGPLGAGKTTLSRGIGEGLNVVGTVSSPTFVIARTHKRTDGGPELVHVDAYRLGSPAELDDLDIDFKNSITLIEWGRGFTDGLSDSWLDIEIERDHTGASEVRNIRVVGEGPRWEAS
jgi:tRNA threonylcarbamoyladenosine biosynthesis protein TsaE